MSSDFQVGDEVVCIEAGDLPTTTIKKHLHLLVLHQIYVVEGVAMAQATDGTLIPAVRLVGIGRGRCFWEACRFRKVQKNLSGMSVLKSLLNKVPEHV